VRATFRRKFYEIELQPDDGYYPLPYMAVQADGSAWEEECAQPFAPEAEARQPFLPDGSRSFEEIDRLGIDDHGLVRSRLNDPSAWR
jgi:L-asparaginase